MISIIVPIYNAVNYLPACIESLLNQTEQDLQIILIDDGSTDNSLVIAQNYADKDKRILVLTQSHAGQSAARNNGLTHAQGEFIAFVDADDAIEPDWCERHLAEIDGVDYAQSGYLQKDKQILPKFRYQFTACWARLYRRKAITDLQFTEGMIYEDIIWSMDLWLLEASCRMINYAGYLYRQNPDGTTSRPHRDAQRRVLNELKSRRKGASYKGKLIITYTMVRLSLYFLFR